MRDFAFSRRSEDGAGSGGASFAPNLYPAGMGAPFIGLEILTLLLISGWRDVLWLWFGSGDGSRSRSRSGGGCGEFGVDLTGSREGW